MFGTLYLRRLGRDLDRWVEERLITTEQAQAILRSARAERASGGPTTLGAVGLIGALLVGIGVISLVAANWDALSKAVKLGLIGAALWAVYGGASIAHARGARPWLAEALLLLGVLVFGASIALVAQIFHLPADAPGGLLLWCLGAFAAAALGPSQPAAVVGVALAALWTGLASGESFGQGPVHWWFLPVWAAWAGLAVLRRWRVAAHAALLALLLWSAFAAQLGGESIGAGAAARLVAAFWTLAMAAAYAGVRADRLPDWAELLRRYALIAVLAAAFLIANLHQWETGEASAPAWTAAAALLLAIGAGIAWRAGRDDIRPLPWLGALGLAVLFAGSGFVPPVHDPLVAVVLHVAYLAGLVGLIAGSRAAEDRFAINLGFVFLALALLDIYFDSAWRLLDRGLAFVAGGVFLLALAWLFERQRRRLIGGLEAQS